MVASSQVPFITKPKVKIWEWNLKFVGEPNSIPVFEFLQKVKELAKSRGASKSDLFEGSTDLFAGSALKWLRTGLEKKAFRNWDELQGQLLADFEAHDYGESLLDYIKNRLQRNNEKIVIYFANMEDLFLKLGGHVTEHLKMEIIRKNLRAEFIRGLGCTQVSSLNELKSLCQSLESDFKRIATRNDCRRESLNKGVRYSNNVQILEEYPYESDYNHYEGDNNWEYQDESYRYRRKESAFIDKKIEELAVRIDPKLPNFSVPPPEFIRHPQANSMPHILSNEKPPQYTSVQYYSPQKNDPECTYYKTGNDSGRFSGTSSTPLVARRPI